jgi:hypothetical protein
MTLIDGIEVGVLSFGAFALSCMSTIIVCVLEVIIYGVEARWNVLDPSLSVC